MRTNLLQSRVSEMERRVSALEGRVSAMERDEALMEAAAKGHIRQCRELIRKGANVNAASPVGKTPLLRASIGGRIETMRLLLDHGADIDALDVQGWGALVRSASQRRPAACRFLIERGANINVAGKNGRTALAWMAFNGSVPACRILVENGASPSYMPPDAPDDYLTAFQTAIAADRPAVVQYFVEEFGADINQRTRNGRTMIDLAEGKPGVKALLLSWKTKESVMDAFSGKEKEPAMPLVLHVQEAAGDTTWTGVNFTTADVVEHLGVVSWTDIPDVEQKRAAEDVGEKIALLSHGISSCYDTALDEALLREANTAILSHRTSSEVRDAMGAIVDQSRDNSAHSPVRAPKAFGAL